MDEHARSRDMKIDKEFEARIPKLKPGELAALEASISAEGCRDPLVVWSRDGKDDVLVDGHNRKAICDRLGVQYKTTRMSFENRQAVIDWMLRHQLGRRNLSKEAAADLIGQVYNQRKMPHGRPEKSPQNEDFSGKTCQAVADELGVGRATVERAGAYASAIDRLTSLLGLMRDELRESEFIRDGETVRGRKLRMADVIDLGKRPGTYEAGKKAGKAYGLSDEDAAAVWKKLTNEGDSCTSVKAAIRELRNEKAARKVKTAKDELVEVRLGDFVEIAKDIPDGSVDIIITDPPYPHEFIGCWSQLSEVAARILKPHGLCIAYSGKLHLDQCMARMGEHLSFYWQIVFMQTVMPTIHPRRVNTKYKPILVFQNVPAGQKVQAHERYFIDVIEGEKVEKDAHEWQQSADGVEKLIDIFTNVNDLIFEPFSGGGTTALVARQMNRRCIACEIDKKAHEGSIARVFGATEATNGR
jgi:hypothetical protein